MLQSPESIQRINYLRGQSRIRELTNEELMEAITLMRQGRVGAAVASGKARASKAPVDTEAMLGDLLKL